jgi:hypothetical protein
VRAAFERLDPRILPDMGVKVTFLGPAPAAGDAARMVVPRAAVQGEKGGAAAFVYRDGRVERRVLRLGPARGTEQEVTEGLREGEQVVVKGLEALSDGQRVQRKD